MKQGGIHRRLFFTSDLKLTILTLRFSGTNFRRKLESWLSTCLLLNETALMRTWYGYYSRTYNANNE